MPLSWPFKTLINWPWRIFRLFFFKLRLEEVNEFSEIILSLGIIKIYPAIKDRIITRNKVGNNLEELFFEVTDEKQNI